MLPVKFLSHIWPFSSDEKETWTQHLMFHLQTDSKVIWRSFRSHGTQWLCPVSASVPSLPVHEASRLRGGAQDFPVLPKCADSCSEVKQDVGLTSDASDQKWLQGAEPQKSHSISLHFLCTSRRPFAGKENAKSLILWRAGKSLFTWCIWTEIWSTLSVLFLLKWKDIVSLMSLSKKNWNTTRQFRFFFFNYYYFLILTFPSWYLDNELQSLPEGPK